MILRSLLPACPAGFEITLADVGSAGGLKDRWSAARPVVAGMLFEPRDGGTVRQQGRDTLYPFALGEAPGRAELYLTGLPNMSSTLRPNTTLMETFRKKGRHTRIVGTLEMPVDSLDNVAAREGKTVDALKIDTQGSELAILRGAEAALGASVILVEVEVSFLERYRDQALFRDIDAYMASRDFELLDLYRLKRYRCLNRAGVANVSLGAGQRAGRLAYGDAFYFLREEELNARLRREGETLALKALIGLLVYGKADMAARLFEQHADLFEPARRDLLAARFGHLARRKIRNNGLHRMLDYLARHV